MSNKDTKDIRFSMRLTEAEYTEICDSAKYYGISLTSYVRARTLGRKISEKAISSTDAANIAHLCRVGNSLKRLLAEEGKFDETTLAEAKNVFEKLKNTVTSIAERYRDLVE